MKFQIKTVFFVILSMFLSMNAQKKLAPEKNSEQPAKDLWELMIKAKGGRENMQSIQNMLIESSGTFKLGLFKKYNSHHISLHVFPNKTWEFEDYRPSVLGMTIRMYNWETEKKYVVDPRQKTAELKSIEQIDIDRMKDINGNIGWAGLVIYLPESRWWKPIPTKLTAERVNGQEVDVIQTVVSEKRVDFFLDRKSHLPVQINFHNYNKVTENTEVDSLAISDYVEVDGLKMNTKLQESDGVKYSLTYQFNVKYNEEIFKTPSLTGEAAKNAWEK